MMHLSSMHTRAGATGRQRPDLAIDDITTDYGILGNRELDGEKILLILPE